MISIIHYNLDLETAQLSKADFFNILIRNDIFSILKQIIVKEEKKDRDFMVYF